MTGQKPSEAISHVLDASDVSVVICAYTDERWGDIVAAVESVSGANAPGEIALVIDHNPDLLEKAKEQFPEGLIIVGNRHKKGLSGARNTGIESTTKPIVAFLDDDAAAEPGWVAAIAAPYADPNVMGVGGHIEPAWTTERPKWWPREFDWVIGCSYKGLPTSRRPVRNPIGANMSVRREAFKAVGGFSFEVGRVGKHPVGGEETELFIRIHDRVDGAVALHEPAAVVHHKVGAERATASYFRRRCYAEGLSKAVISQLAKSDENLSSEWDYTLKTLPLGALRGLRDAIKGDSGGLGRAVAITGGLLITTAGYLRGRLHKGPERNLTEVPLSSEAA